MTAVKVIGIGLVLGAAALTSHPLLGSGGGDLLAPLVSAVLTQPFGCTDLVIEPADPSCPGGHFHSGVDLAAPTGSPVLSAIEGTVQVGHDPGGYGLFVVIDGGQGLSTLYGHLSAVDVRSGLWVAAGIQIGTVGASGLATGPHLHFEVRRQGRPVDPSPLLPAGFIKGSASYGQ